eukprot:CAMPEP_0184548718 /NCGR_PEP_ID=MMETSP0199_2-20130426/6369_1 /TAXON_ID=1112570 /ORGANISM="Thraustochytrium sp., Strain LLF1b" /LENGTH=494 /DNA_ID=CAMNT_0026943353 /DNA_START=65 /DNA_END=1549 /DNA_ORIENTATION=+
MAEAKAVDELRATFYSGKTRSLKWRRQQLTQVQLMMEENHEQFAEALKKDLGGPDIRAVFEFAGHQQAQIALDNLSSWTAERKRPHTELLGRSYIRPEPKGVVLIIAPFNFPFTLALDPLVASIAAGNCAIIKPSEMAPACAQLMETLVHKYLDTDCVRVIQGAIPETTRLLECKFDHIMYTGNGTVARIVMKAAAKNLTPVTLELGGKSPVIVDETANLDIAARRILLTKELNNGQICVAADYVLAHDSVKDELIATLTKLAKDSWGADAKGNKDYGKIINERHANRIQGLVSSTTGKVILPCDQETDTSDCFVPPTIIDGPSLDDEVMKEEIFGPVLPIRTFTTLKEAVEEVNNVCREPLALYVFSSSKKNIEYVLSHTQSGGVSINSVLEQVSNPNLPFGGFGESGMGSYHGKDGFEEFSHKRSVFVKDTLVNKDGAVPRAPYPDWLAGVALKLSVLGFIPRKYRFVKPATAVKALLVVLTALVVRSKVNK